MFPAPRLLTLQVSTLALWGALAAAPQTAWGYSAVPAIRGAARLDAVVANYNVGIEQRCLNDGSGGFTNCTNVSSIGSSSSSIVLGDVDNDGDLDVLVANTDGEVEQRCLNDGSGGFINCASFNTTDYSFGIALGDVDGDGDLDVLVANFKQVEQRCLNDGSGGFTSCASFNTTDYSVGIVLGDVDGDGDLDALLANFTEVEQRCLNDGSGGFTSCATFNGADYSNGIALGDLDGDGDLDALVANFGNEQRCLNDGSGGFTACVSFNGADYSNGIVLGDVDGDKDLDVVVANAIGQVEQRCLNDGSGGFTACASFNTTDDSFGIALGDVDGDGDLDALVANFGEVEQRCLNDGSGGFTTCASFNTTNNSYGIALGDLKGDGPDGNLTDVTTKFVGGVSTSNFALTPASAIIGVKPAGLVALYEFDTKYCANGLSLIENLTNLRTRTIRITKGNALNFDGLTSAEFLTAPEWREGGIGAELVMPTAGQTFGYADGELQSGECAVIHYTFNLFSLSKYRFAVRLYGTLGGDTLGDSLAVASSSANDLSAVAATEIELDLGSLQAAPETTTPPATTTPGGSAPTPVTPTLSFPAGTSNLPSRR